MSAIELTLCSFCGVYSQCEIYRFYHPGTLTTIFAPVCDMCRKMYMVDRAEAQETLDQWKSDADRMLANEKHPQRTKDLGDA